MSDIQEEQKRLYKRAEENDYIVKDIAQYEENDSKLAKYTILELQKQLDFMIDKNDEKQDRINEAIEYIENVIRYYNGEDIEKAFYLYIHKDMVHDLLNILKGDNK